MTSSDEEIDLLCDTRLRLKHSKTETSILHNSAHINSAARSPYPIRPSVSDYRLSSSPHLVEQLTPHPSRITPQPSQIFTLDNFEVVGPANEVLTESLSSLDQQPVSFTLQEGPTIRLDNVPKNVMKVKPEEGEPKSKMDDLNTTSNDSMVNDVPLKADINREVDAAVPATNSSSIADNHEFLLKAAVGSYHMTPDRDSRQSVLPLQATAFNSVVPKNYYATESHYPVDNLKEDSDFNTNATANSQRILQINDRNHGASSETESLMKHKSPRLHKKKNLNPERQPLMKPQYWTYESDSDDSIHLPRYHITRELSQMENTKFVYLLAFTGFLNAYAISALVGNLLDELVAESFPAAGFGKKSHTLTVEEVINDLGTGTEDGHSSAKSKNKRMLEVDFLFRVGFVWLAEPLGSIIFGTLAGCLVHGLGYRLAFLWGAMVEIVSCLGLSLSHEFAVIIACRVLQGLGGPLLVSSSPTILVILSGGDEDIAQRALNFAWLGVPAGFLIGQFLAGYPYSELGMHVFMILAITNIIGIVIAIRCKDDESNSLFGSATSSTGTVSSTAPEADQQGRRAKKKKKTSSSCQQTFLQMGNSSMMLACLTQVILYIGITYSWILNSFWPVEALKGRKFEVSMIGGAGDILMIVVAASIGTFIILRKWSRSKVSLIGCLGVAISYSFIPPAEHDWKLWSVPVFVLSAGGGFIISSIPPLIAQLSRKNHEAQYGTSFALLEMSANIGQAIGGAGGAIIGLLWGFENLSLLLGGFLVLLSLPLLKLVRSVH